MAYSVIFDWKRTLYDPETRSLIEGATEVLDYLHMKNITMYLIGKGDVDMHGEVERLNVKPYFEDIVFLEGDKQPDHYRLYISRTDPDRTLIIGDKLDSEIEVGNLLGATTIQVRQGKFAGHRPKSANQKPDMVVNNLSELLPLLVVYA